MSTKPASQTILRWLKLNLGPRCLAPLTGTDAKALLAATQIVELWSYDRSEPTAKAFGLVVSRMQDHCKYFAFHATAHVMDWSHRAELWAMAGLPPLGPIPKCDAER